MTANTTVELPRQFRYERKFLVSDLTYAEIESIVRLNPAVFSEIHHVRWVNNIYFDSPELESYADNLYGSLTRVKMRIRWYGELTGLIEKPTLEFKFKQGLLGRKESFSLIPFTFDESFNQETLTRLIKDSALTDLIRLKMKSLEPVLLNRYRRKYFLSADRRFRITLDGEQKFWALDARNHRLRHEIQNDRDVVLELKYDQPHDDESQVITNHFPFRVTKSSKYVMGVDTVHTW